MPDKQLSIEADFYGRTSAMEPAINAASVAVYDEKSAGCAGVSCD